MTEAQTELFLIRHAEAVSNVEPTVAGMAGDRGLTERGVRQAERLRERLVAGGEIRPDVFLASTLPRARQTAEIIQPALGVPVRWDDELHEFRVGPEADGLSLEAFLERYGRPEIFQDPFRPVAPGGESWAEFALRATRALHRIIHEHAGKRILVLCHGGIVDASFTYFMGLRGLFPAPVAFDTQNTSITHWDEQQVEPGPGRWRLRRYNDDGHLRDASGKRVV